MNKSITSNELNQKLKNSQQIKVQDQMALQVKSTRHLEFIPILLKILPKTAEEGTTCNSFYQIRYLFYVSESLVVSIRNPFRLIQSEKEFIGRNISKAMTTQLRRKQDPSRGGYSEDHRKHHQNLLVKSLQSPLPLFSPWL